MSVKNLINRMNQFGVNTNRLTLHLDNKTAEVRDRVNELKMEEKELSNRLDMTLIALNAMWELLTENTDVSEDDLMEKINEIDIRDGIQDGKMSQKKIKCPNCQHIISIKFKKCLFCGEDCKDLVDNIRPIERI